MSNPSDTPVTPGLLRAWGLPDPGESKHSRGEVVVVGGSLRSPGAVLLAGEAALRVGAGKAGLAVPAAIETQIGVAMPEAGVYALPDVARQPFSADLRSAIASAGAVLVGPGFDGPDETRAAVVAVAGLEPGCLVLDAFALGVLPDIDRATLPASLILSPNREEAAILLGRDPADDRSPDVPEIARRWDAIVSCYGRIATPDGTAWQITAGGPGLGTAGSGDVLAGAIAGFAARGTDPAQAAVWGSWAHATAGDRLTGRLGLGFLARELLPELARTIAGIGSSSGGDQPPL